jgi:hypothetical protein
MDILPDDVLLDIFDFHVKHTYFFPSQRINAWHLLIHVCRRWRNLVLSSSHRLNLRLLCTERTPTREMLDLWPAFLPIVIWSGGDPMDLDNLIAALEKTDRICEISFEEMASEAVECLSTAMHGPFPALETLDIMLGDRDPFFPEPFLDSQNSAPCLRRLALTFIEFSAVHKLLLSAGGLVDLSVIDVLEYESPETIATYLSSMTRLESMTLCFRHAQHYPPIKPQYSSSQPRIVLPALTYLGLEVPRGYQEDLMARLDAPRLDKVTIHYSDYPFEAEDIDYLMQIERE